MKKRLVLSIAMIQFLSNCAFVQMSPFYPIKAKETGIDQIYVGFIFGVMAICQVFASLLVGSCLHRFDVERYQIIMLGSLLIIAQTLLLGSLDYVKNKNLFIALSFIA